MGTWQYAFMFPPRYQKLAPDAALDVIRDAGFSLDANSSKLARCITANEPFEVSCHDVDYYFAFSYQPDSLNPHLVLAGLKRTIVNEFSKVRREQHYQMLARSALKANAAYVILVTEAPFDFEGQFFEIEGRRVLDQVMPGGYRCEIDGIWIRDALNEPFPEGVAPDNPVEIGEGFREYKAAD